MAQHVEIPALIRRLVDTFDAEGITSCHWKSNDMLAASESGENDLDLLVSRADVTRARVVLHRLGFVEAVQRPSRRVPGVLDYHGNDPDLDRPVHVHLHTRLVLGDDMTKNYHLPIEDEYLASARRQGLFHVPAPELELVVFVVRMVLKHCALDAILMLQGRMAASERREWTYLSGRADRARSRAMVEQLLPEVDGTLFDACCAVISQDVGPLRRVRVGRRLERALDACSRRPLPVDVSLKAARRVYWLSRRYLAPRSRRKALAHGGLVVAIGGRAPLSQRRAIVEQLDRWLRRDFAVLPVEYAGSPQRVARRARRFAAGGGIVLSADHPSRRSGDGVPGLPRPDLEIRLLADAAPDEPTESSAAGVVHIGADDTAARVYASVQRALWDRL